MISMSNIIPSENIDKEMEEISKSSGGMFRSRFGLWFLGIISFAESMLFAPIVTDPFMVAYILFNRARTFVAVMVTTLTSVAGGVMAYLIAVYFIDLAFNYLSPDAVAQFTELSTKYGDSVFVLAFLGALTPIPYTLTAVVAGAIKGNLLLFILGSFIGRAIRYGIVGYLAYRFGEEAMKIVRGNIKLITVVAFILAGIYLFLMYVS